MTTDIVRWNPESGWYAGPYEDEVYYLAPTGEWMTSRMMREDTSYLKTRLIEAIGHSCDHHALARIEAERKLRKIRGLLLDEADAIPETTFRRLMELLV